MLFPWVFAWFTLCADLGRHQEHGEHLQSHLVQAEPRRQKSSSYVGALVSGCCASEKPYPLTFYEVSMRWPCTKKNLLRLQVVSLGAVCSRFWESQMSNIGELGACGKLQPASSSEARAGRRNQNF